MLASFLEQCLIFKDFGEIFLKMYQKMFLALNFVDSVEISKIRIGSNIFNFAKYIWVDGNNICLIFALGVSWITEMIDVIHIKKSDKLMWLNFLFVLFFFLGRILCALCKGLCYIVESVSLREYLQRVFHYILHCILGEHFVFLVNWCKN